MDLAALLAADAVLDPDDALDLPLDLSAVAVGLGHHLDGLARVLLDVELGAVEEHRVPAGPQARGDPLAIGTVVEVQGHRHGRVVGPHAPHRVEGAGADRLHRLQRRLDDERRLEIGGRGQHRLERQVVDDVDRRHAVALREGRIEDLTHGHDGHGTAALLSIPGQRRCGRNDVPADANRIDLRADQGWTTAWGASSRRARRSSTSRRAAASESARRRATSCAGSRPRYARISAWRSAAGRARSCSQTASAVIVADCRRGRRATRRRIGAPRCASRRPSRGLMSSPERRRVVGCRAANDRERQP